MKPRSFPTPIKLSFGPESPEACWRAGGDSALWQAAGEPWHLQGPRMGSQQNLRQARIRQPPLRRLTSNKQTKHMTGCSDNSSVTSTRL